MSLLGIILFAVFGTIVVDSVSLDDQLEWISWKIKYNKKYDSKESEKAHLEIWLRNKVIVEEHNRLTDVTFKMELNHFADQVITTSLVLNQDEYCFICTAPFNTISPSCLDNFQDRYWFKFTIYCLETSS